MGFGDKLKGLRDQAQAAVADNKDKIQGAVQSAGEVANTKTHGKYADKIVKVGDKMNASVEKLERSTRGGRHFCAGIRRGRRDHRTRRRDRLLRRAACGNSRRLGR